MLQNVDPACGVSRFTTPLPGGIHTASLEASRLRRTEGNCGVRYDETADCSADENIPTIRPGIWPVTASSEPTPAVDISRTPREHAVDFAERTVRSRSKIAVRCLRDRRWRWRFWGMLRTGPSLTAGPPLSSWPGPITVSGGVRDRGQGIASIGCCAPGLGLEVALGLRREYGVFKIEIVTEGQAPARGSFRRRRRLVTRRRGTDRLC